MLINLVTPELVIGKAWSDLVSARLFTREFTVWAQKDEVDWTIAHTFYANMGGFVIRFPQADDAEANCQTTAGMKNEPEPQLRNSSEENRPRNHLPGCDEESQKAPLQQPTSKAEHTPTPVLETELEPQDANALSGEVKEGDQSKPGNVPKTAQITKLPGRDDSSTHAMQKIERRSTNGVVIDVTHMPKDFQTLVFRRSMGIDAYEQLISTVRPWVGHIDWQVDPENQATVVSVLQDVTHANTANKSSAQWLCNVIPLKGNIWVPDASQILFARESGIISRLPSLPEEQLDDQTKTSFMLKAITLIQIAWLILEMIVRKTEGLPSSQLEIAVLAFAVLSLISYSLLWSKPQDVQACHYILATRRPLKQEVEEIGRIGPNIAGPPRTTPWIPDSYLHLQGRNGAGGKQSFFLGVIAGAIAFGALHCLAWNARFPTDTERLLWRISSLYLMISPVVGASLISLCFWVIRRLNVRLDFVVRVVGQTAYANLLMWPYFFCRLFLIVETFRALCFSPPDVFRSTDWPNYFPHLM
jgi:hypothetical protein